MEFFIKKLSNYPAISEWEIQNVLDFEHYEKQNGRDCFIEAYHDSLKAIENYKRIYESGKRVNVPEKITECKTNRDETRFRAAAYFWGHHYQEMAIAEKQMKPRGIMSKMTATDQHKWNRKNCN